MRKIEIWNELLKTAAVKELTTMMETDSGTSWDVWFILLPTRERVINLNTNKS